MLGSDNQFLRSFSIRNNIHSHLTSKPVLLMGEMCVGPIEFLEETIKRSSGAN